MGSEMCIRDSNYLLGCHQPLQPSTSSVSAHQSISTGRRVVLCFARPVTSGTTSCIVPDTNHSLYCIIPQSTIINSSGHCCDSLFVIVNFLGLQQYVRYLVCTYIRIPKSSLFGIPTGRKKNEIQSCRHFTYFVGTFRSILKDV